MPGHVDIADLWLRKGTVLLHLERYPESIDAFTQSLEVSPDTVAGWYRKGKSFMHLAKYPEAVECFDQVVSRNDDCDGAWLRKGSAHLSIGQFEPAVTGIRPCTRIETTERKRLVRPGNRPYGAEAL